MEIKNVSVISILTRKWGKEIVTLEADLPNLVENFLFTTNSKLLLLNQHKNAYKEIVTRNI